MLHHREINVDLHVTTKRKDGSLGRVTRRGEGTCQHVGRACHAQTMREHRARRRAEIAAMQRVCDMACAWRFNGGGSIMPINDIFQAVEDYKALMAKR